MKTYSLTLGERWWPAAVLPAAALSVAVNLHPQPFVWEIAFTRWMQQWHWLRLLPAAVSWPGEYVFVQGFMLMLICGVLARRGWAREARTLAYVGVGAFLLNVGLKALVARPRPTTDLVRLYVVAGGWSFPSGHVMFYTAFYGGLAAFAKSKMSPGLWRTVVIGLCAILVGLVGPSRVFLGAHWLTDAAAGYGYGLAWLLITGRSLWRRCDERVLQKAT